MRMRILVVLATVAALLGAPSIASGADNSLVAPSVSPTSGTVATIFTLRVTYDGMFPATALTVAVAGLQLPLVRVTGSPELGDWSVSTTLPAGTWTPTFSAGATQGNSAGVDGPTISVDGLPAIGATPAPTVTAPMPSRANEPDSEGPAGSGDPGTGADPDPDLDPAPAEVGDASPSADAEPVASIVASPAPGAVPASARAEAGGPGGPTSSPAAGGTAGGAGGKGGAPAAPAEKDRRPRSGEPQGMPTAGQLGAAEVDGMVTDPLLGIVLLVGLSGVAAVALIGGVVLSIGRRRSDDDETSAAEAQARETEALLERRTLRQAKVRLTDDPIVAAMGVDDQVAARRRRRAPGQVASGPDERPVRRRS